MSDSDSTRNGFIRAATYVRMSSEKQTASPSQQKAAIAKLAAREKCEIVRHYEDLGISGDRSERPEFERMLTDAERGEFDAILCWDGSRLARADSVEAGHIAFRLRRGGVQVITVAEGEID